MSIWEERCYPSREWRSIEAKTAELESRLLKIAADGFRVAGVEVGDEKECDAEDDEGDEAVRTFLAPDVEDYDFSDTN